MEDEKKYKIAVVEDDELIRHMIKLNLEKNGYRVKSFLEAELLLKKTREEPFDLIVLDILLPGMSGLNLVRELRAKDIEVPILMVTAKNQVQDKIHALNLGADDYLVKPFNIDELLARVKALIRRSHGRRTLPSDRLLFINDFRIDLSSRECDSNLGKKVLSGKETKLLAFFVAHAGEILRRADILEEVWGMDVSPTPRTVDNFILKFRKLFEDDPENPRHFISVRNRGYLFQV